MIKIGNSASHISTYTCQPKSKSELKDIIEERISKEGPNCDLNDIDTSEITDMSFLFERTDFNGDISKWNTSNVFNMIWMFAFSKFNGDISNWNVGNVKDMYSMFVGSAFNGDISNWEINKDCNVNFMFDSCPIEEKFKPKSLQQS